MVVFEALSLRTALKNKVLTLPLFPYNKCLWVMHVLRKSTWKSGGCTRRELGDLLGDTPEGLPQQTSLCTNVAGKVFVLCLGSLPWHSLKAQLEENPRSTLLCTCHLCQQDPLWESTRARSLSAWLQSDTFGAAGTSSLESWSPILRDDLPGAMCFFAGEDKPSAILAALSKASQTRRPQARPGWTFSAQMLHCPMDLLGPMGS